MTTIRDWGDDGAIFERRINRICNSGCKEHHAHFEAKYRQIPGKVLVVPLDDPIKVKQSQKILDAYTDVDVR